MSNTGNRTDLEVDPGTDRVSAFIRLFTTHEAHLSAFAMSLVPNWADADDLLQQTNLVLWKKFDQFQLGSNFFSWASRILYLEAKEFRKKQLRSKLRFSDAFLETVAREADGLADELAERQRLLAHCFGVFHLGLYDGTGDLAVDLDGSKPNGPHVREGRDHPFPINQWVHVAFTTDGTTVRLYRDGREVASGPSRPLAAVVPVRSLAIGFKTDDSGVSPSSPIAVGFWDGRIGDLALFNRPLSADEIRRLADIGRPE